MESWCQKNSKAIIWLAVLFNFAANGLSSQRLFLCDSTKKSNVFYGECNYIYDPISREKDSILYIEPVTNEIKLKKIQIRALSNNDNQLDGGAWGYADSLLIFKANYEKGKLNGLYVRHYEAGYVDSIPFKNGVLDGRRVYHMGNQKMIIFYKAGLIEGEVRRIDSNGQVLYFCPYVEGKKNGVEYLFFDSGHLAEFTIFKNGKMIDGHHYSFNISGYIEVERVVDKGHLMSEIFYNSVGEVIKRIDY